MKNDRVLTNKDPNREDWLQAAIVELRPYFEKQKYPLPQKIRCAIAFPSTGRTGNRVGECWHCSASADGYYEIIVRADKSEPVEVLGILVHELVHTVLPPSAGHGKAYRDAAVTIGLTGKMRHAMPGPLLQDHLKAVAATVKAALGPLPHAPLRIEDGRDGPRPADRPKKQRARLLKAECETEGCGYNVRIVGKWVREVGEPPCPKHGPMKCEMPPDAV